MLSPGANLPSAEEQADAAFADLIIASMDQQGIKELSDDDLIAIARGGSMWEESSTNRRNQLGFLGDLTNALFALFGGAHIEKNKYGET